VTTPAALRKQIAGLSQVASAQKTIRAKADPVAFAKAVGIEPDGWQIRVLRSTSKRLLLNCCRQSGKSTTSAVRSLWRALFFSRSLVLIISPTQRQSFELLRKVQQLVQRLDGLMSPPVEKNNSSELEFANGSRIVSLPGENEHTIRGYSAATEIIVDEAGDVQDDIFDAILPMLTISRGSLLCAGTPKGQRGKFWQWWTGQDDYYERTEATWRDCPRIDRKDIDRARLELGEKFAQEYECQFLRLSGGVIYPAFSVNENVIAASPVGRDVWTYLLAIDFGYVDATAFAILGWRANERIVYCLHSYQKSGMLVDDIAEYAKNLSARWPFRTIIGDIGGYGKGPAMELGARYGLHIEPAPKTDKAGWISIVNAAFARKEFLIVGAENVELVDELVKLPWNATRTDSMAGYTDHLSDAASYGFRVALAYLEPDAPKPITTEADRIREEMRVYWQGLAEKQQAEEQFTGAPEQNAVADYLTALGVEQ
jgi:hypothetical protein